MSIPNYRPPRHELEQDFLDDLPSGLDRNNLIVVGPAYVHADEGSGNLVFKPYTEANLYGYERLDGGEVVGNPAMHEVNVSEVEAVVRGAWLRLYEKGSSGGVAQNDGFNLYEPSRSGDVIHYKTFGGEGFLDLDSTIPADNFDSGRSVQAGDVLEIEGSGGTVTRQVKALLGKDVEASVDSGGYGALVAKDLAGASSAPVFGVSYSGPGSVGAPDITLDTSSLAGVEMTNWARRYGQISPELGIRLSISLKVTASGDADTAEFTAVVGGRNTAVSNATDAGTGTDFTILGEVINVDHATWVIGETLNFHLDLPSTAASNLLGDGGNSISIDTSKVYYNSVEVRKPTSLILEVLDVDDPGAQATIFNGSIVSFNGSTVELVGSIDPATTPIIIRVSDTQGLVTPKFVRLQSANVFSVDYNGVVNGITVELQSGFMDSAHVGQRLTAPINPPSRSSRIFDKVQLDSPLGPITDGLPSNDSLKVTAYVEFSGRVKPQNEVSGAVNFSAQADGVSVTQISAPVDGYNLQSSSIKVARSGKGEIAFEWKSLIPVSEDETPFLVSGSSDIEQHLGSFAMASELGYGLYMGVRAADKTVFGLKVGGTSLEDWQAAIKTLSLQRNIYTIAPITNDERVLSLFASHAAEMNRPEIKRFRRVYGGVDSPGEYVKFSEHDGNQLAATFVEGGGGKNTLVTFSNKGIGLNSKKIYPGDKVRVLSSGEYYTISYVGGADTLVLESGPPSPISSATPVEIVASDTSQNIADYVSSFAQRLGAGLEEDRRICCIWNDRGYVDLGTGVAKVVPNRFLAAEAAGYRVNLLPQQSLTRQQIFGITDSPRMYSKFTDNQLNQMASNGVWIVMQDAPGLTPYYRHQLTTAVDGGPLRYEDSAGVIYDFISFDLDDIIEPLIGKRNVTRETLAEVKNLVVAKMLEHTTTPPENPTVGPMLIGFYDREGNEGTVNVDFDPEFKDAILLFTEIEVPLTLNNARTRVLARTINLERGATSEIVVQTV